MKPSSDLDWLTSQAAEVRPWEPPDGGARGASGALGAPPARSGSPDGDARGRLTATLGTDDAEVSERERSEHRDPASRGAWSASAASIGRERSEHGARGAADSQGTRAATGPRRGRAGAKRPLSASEASLHAEAVLAQARIEAEEIRARSREEGLAEGRAMGLAECRPARAALEEWFERLDLAFQEFCEAQIPALVDLAVSAAEVLLREQLDLAPERIRAVCRDALDRVAGASGVTVYLHPDDIPLVVDSCQLTVDSGDGAPPSLSTVNGQLSTGVIVPDPTLERGGCRIESDCGTVDATISGRVARLRAAMSDPS